VSTLADAIIEVIHDSGVLRSWHCRCGHAHHEDPCECGRADPQPHVCSIHRLEATIRELVKKRRRQA